MALKTILINNQQFQYDEKIISYDDCRPITENEAKHILELTKRLFNKKGLEFYLCFGTLLGAVRDKGVIIGDEDVDVFVDNENLLISIIPYLYENGLKLFRQIKGKIYSFHDENGIYIDVYILRSFKNSIWSLYCYSLARLATPKYYFKYYQDIEFLGNTYKCPKDPEKILEFWYGKTWRVPIKGFHAFAEVKSHYYWKKSIKKIKYTVQKIIIWDKWKHYIKK